MTRPTMTLATAPELMTTRQLADLLQIPISTVYAHNHARSGPRFVRVGGRSVRYHRRDVEEWLEANRVT